MAYDIGPRIGIEGEAEFRRSIRNINTTLRTLGTEMQAVTSAYDRNDRSAESLGAQNDVLKKQIEAQREKLQQLSEGLSKATERYGESDRVTQGWQQAVNRATAELNNMERQLRENEQAINDADDSISDMSGGMDNAGDRASVFGQVLAADLVSKGIEMVVEAAMEAVKAIAEFAIEADEAMHKMRAQLGLTEEAARDFEKNALNIFGDNFGENVGEVTEDLARVKQMFGELSGEELENITKNAYTMRDAFDIDVNEGLRGVSSLMKQFGITAEEAFDLIVKGSQNGLNQNQDLADQVAEYSVYFADMGYTAQEFFDMMHSGAKDGAFQIDYLNDVVKEFGIRTKDNSKTSADAFAALGLDSQAMFSAFAAGGDQAKQASKTVTDALFGVQDRVKQNEIGVALFGTKWEDLGVDAVQAIMQMKTELGNAQGATQEAADAMYSSFSSKAQGMMRDVQSAIVMLANDLISPEEFQGKISGTMESGIQMIMENIPKFLDAGLEIVVGLGRGIAEHADELAPAAIQMIEQLAITIASHIPELVEVTAKIMLALGKGLIKRIPILLQAVPNIIAALFQALKESIEPALEIGENLVKGIYKGIINTKDWFIKKLKSWGKSILDAVKDFFGIHSPSRVFQDEIGKNIVLGTAKGIEKEDAAEKAAEQMSKDILSAATKWVSDKKFYNEMSEAEELDFWEDLVTMAGLKSNELQEINKKIYTARQKLIQEDQKALEEYERKLESRKSVLEGFAGLFDAIEKKNNLSGTQLLENLQSQVNAFKGWQKDMEELAERGVTEPLLQELKEMGPKAAEQIQALTTLSDEELKEYVNLFKEKGELVAEQARREIGGIEIPLVVTNDEETMKSNTAVLIPAAEQTVSALAEGIQGNIYKISDMAQKIAAEYIQKINASRNGFYQAGGNMVAGLWEGIRSGKSGLINNIVQMLQDVVAAAKEAMDIHSPSRVWAEVGHYMAAGLGTGFTDQMRDVTRQITDSIPAPAAMSSVTASAKIGEGVVNGLASVMHTPQVGTEPIVVKVVLDSKVIAQETLEPLRQVAKQRGVAFG